MIFYSLTSAGPEGGVETPSLKGEVLTNLRDPAGVYVSDKMMFDRY